MPTEFDLTYAALVRTQPVSQAISLMVDILDDGGHILYLGPRHDFVRLTFNAAGTLVSWDVNLGR